MFQRPSTLRRAARWALLWFACFVLAGVASAALAPQALQQVCSADGSARWVPLPGDAAPAALHLLHCPLCLDTVAPPTAVATLSLPTVYRSVPGAVAVSLRHGVRSAGPLPGRGPPWAQG